MKGVAPLTSAQARETRVEVILEAAGGALHVRNAPSTAATASLAIASAVIDRAAGAFAGRGGESCAS